MVSRYGNNFVKTILKKIETNSEISVVNDQYGTPTSAEFIADFLCELLQLESIESKKGLYHICAEGETTWYGLADFILKTFMELKIFQKKHSFLYVCFNKYFKNLCEKTKKFTAVLQFT